ncbi:DNA-binding response regulator [Vibrio lentus]|uniref:response regulator transcription factor n=1 Tax=Vibrio lentus TaxID=136468 RepID=UPI000C81C412|nr:response regulator transcription factor [Vibrio lentus]MCC4815839.1 response regulator transcription factor [Vibrio lentus]PMG68072.1 DNA-binding response regulator [Vibrio lentus]PMI93396.1 DNA-binding response regulator [Vibrio lentus]PMK94179.1 DNA-binding response regulator [Vibrio lentus]PML24860.1 DNA-binding response regulator [Vibrio lentus]
MSKTKVLIVEDDQEIARLTTLYLEAEGYNVSVVHDGNLALEAIRNTEPDLVLLDLMLPGLSGTQICRQAREFYNGIILVLTASADEMSEVSLFKFGADDYVTKPIRGHALLARIEALLRRASPAVETMDTGTEKQCDIVINNTAQSATLYGQNLKLTSAEFEILNLLVNNICQVVTRDQCCQLFRGIDYAFNDRSIDMRVSGLRRKLRIHAKDKQLIRTVRNKGYMLVA